ncbi:MAG: MOSC domain-containing protein [Kiloniellales bacterium]
MPVSIAHIYRYPVKGLSAAPLDRVALTPGQGLAHDRRFALAHATARFEGATHWLPRRNFLMLARNPRLAALETAFDPESETLTVARDGKVVARGKMTEPAGRAVLEDFFAAYTGDEAPDRPRLVEASDQPFSDLPEPFLSIINLASVAALERRVGAPIDPVRFRGNLYIDGTEPWTEFTWVGREIEAGVARFRIVEPIERCAATNVNPDSGVRDMNLPKALADDFGHVDMGVYAEVVAGGEVAVGDPVRMPL